MRPFPFVPRCYCKGRIDSFWPGTLHILLSLGAHCFLLGHKMTATFAITQIVSVEAVESEQFEVRLMLEDTSEVVLRMDGPTLCTLADMVSQYATA